MQDVNGDTLNLGDQVKIWNDKNQYVWRVTEQLDNGAVIIHRAGREPGIVNPTKLIWVSTPLNPKDYQ
jgi:hypothetical protein